MTEITRKSWKQPIPTDLDTLTKGDVFASTLLAELLRRCVNSDKTVYVDEVPIQLKRGECVCGSFELAKRFGLKKSEHRRVTRKLCKLENPLNLLTKRKSFNCSVISINNYDALVNMTSRLTKQRPNGDQTVTTYKSVKSDKKEMENSLLRKKSLNHKQLASEMRDEDLIANINDHTKEIPQEYFLEAKERKLL
jgi:hypothetical protein